MIDESDRMFIGRFLPPEEIGPWIEAQTCSRTVRGIVTHHTWSPDQYGWRGIATLDGIFDYYRHVKKWPSGVGPHFFIGPETRYGQSPIGVWIATHFAHEGIHVKGYNEGTIGVEYVWNGDQAPFPAEYLRVGAILHQALSRKLGVPLVRTADRSPGLFFHRDHASKSCPGNKVLHATVFAAYRQETQEDDMTPDQDQRLKRLEIAVAELQEDVDRSQRAVSFRETIQIAILCGDWDRAKTLADAAEGQGVRTGFSSPK